MNTSPIFSADDKLYDIVSTNPKLLLLLSRFGIELGFGDQNVHEVCQRNHISTDLFLLVCNIYSNPDYTPRRSDFEAIDMEGLLPYLQASHQYYTEVRFPHIEEHLQHILDAAQPRHAKMLQRFYEDYRNEVNQHFKYEEEVVFPYILSLCQGKADRKFGIGEFKENHTNIEDTLEDMMNILIKYLPGDILPKERIEISMDIMELSADLISHTMIEDRILVPYVESLENARP